MSEKSDEDATGHLIIIAEILFVFGIPAFFGGLGAMIGDLHSVKGLGWAGSGLGAMISALILFCLMLPATSKGADHE